MLIRALFALMVLCLPTLSQAQLTDETWDDELESGNTDFSAAYMVSTMIPQGTMAYDTATKFSGSGSLRVNFPLACDVTSLTGQCGGSITRTFLPRAEVYKRVHFMMSGSITPLTAPNANCITANCLFKTSGLSSTKMIQGASQDQGAFTEKNIRHWWQQGKNGGKTFILSAEHVPTYVSTTDVPFSSHNFVDNRWYCIETRERVNTPGVANGIGQAWIDGVQVLNRTDIMWQRAANGTVSPGNFLWSQFQFVRQNGAGYFWFDRIAVKSTRIGCVGNPSPTDTTAPTPPTSLTAQ